MDKTLPDALTLRDSLCSGHRIATYTPDVLIEFYDILSSGVPDVRYAIALDAKYRKPLRDDVWDEVRKYGDMRATVTRRQVVKQIWLAYPGADGAAIQDDSIDWSSSSPERLNESFNATLGIAPAEPDPALDATAARIGSYDPAPVATKFARELTRFVTGEVLGT